MTVLNSRWITRKFETVPYPNALSAVKILANLQYTSFFDYFLSTYYQEMTIGGTTSHNSSIIKVPGLFPLYHWDHHCIYIHFTIIDSIETPRPTLRNHRSPIDYGIFSLCGDVVLSLTPFTPYHCFFYLSWIYWLRKMLAVITVCIFQLNLMVDALHL
jgi:hypothetical protein